MNNRKYLLNIKTWFIILVHYFLYFTFLSRTNTIYAKAGKGNDSSFFLTTTTISSQTSRYLICILHLPPHRCLSLSVKLSDLCSMRLVLISVSVFRMNVNYILSFIFNPFTPCELLDLSRYWPTFKQQSRKR